jgi:hypothetical protein
MRAVKITRSSGRISKPRNIIIIECYRENVAQSALVPGFASCGVSVGRIFRRRKKNETPGTKRTYCPLRGVLEKKM